MSSTTHAKAPQSTREPDSSLVSGPPGTGLSMQDLYGNEFMRSLMAPPSGSTAFDRSPHPIELPQAAVDGPAMPGSQVGLVVRGKRALDHEPSPLETHADVLMSNGKPVGFFGQDAREGNGSQGAGFGLPGRVGTPDRMSGQQRAREPSVTGS